MSIETIRMSKKSVTRLFVGAIVAVGAGLVLGIAALSAALATDAIDFGGSYVIDVSGGSGAWVALGLVIVGSLAILGGTIAAVVSWIGALLNTWQLEDKMWFASLLALGLLGFGVVAMIAYIVAGPDGTKQSVARPGTAGAGSPGAPSTGAVP
jgi:ABC-type Na+ efflux pump permease subunit